MDLFTSMFSHLFSIDHYFETGSSCGCVNTYALWDIMSKVRDNKRYAIPPIKQIDVTFFPSHVSVNQSQLILTARQKQKTKNKNKNKQTYQKRERQHLNLSCNILHDFVFFGIQWWHKNLHKRGRASTLRFPSPTRWGKLRTSSDVTLTRLFYVVFLL